MTAAIEIDHAREVKSATCKHCNNTLTSSSNAEFCCAGCEFVYNTINGLGFSHYYRLRKDQSADRTKPFKGDASSFEFVDDANFLTKHVTFDSTASSASVNLFLEGIHCAACIWLLEKLPEIADGVISAQVHFIEGTVKVTYNPNNIKLSQVCSAVNSLGYSPAPILISADTTKIKKSNRVFLYRLGVAAVCNMNIMMMSVSLYQADFTGIELHYRNLLSWASLVLALPVLFFSAIPFFRTSIGGLKAGVLHIDLPISLAIIAGFAVSCANTILARPGIYYDSITALVLLLLSGRWLQHRTVQRVSDSATLLQSLTPKVAHRISPKAGDVYVGSLEIGDIVCINENEKVPADGIVHSGASSVSLAILTGESAPCKIGPGDLIFAGTTLIGSPINIKITAAGQDSRLGKILRYVSESPNTPPPIELFLNRVSKGFTAVVLIAAIFTFLFWSQISYEKGINNAIALLIVTCPCVLALATPLTFTVAILKAAKKGILFRSAEAIEFLSQIKTLVLDKTGTITTGEVAVLSAKIEPNIDRSELKQAIASLELGIHHPVAHALRAWSSSEINTLTVNNRKITPGLGIEGEINNKSWKIGSAQFLNQTINTESQHGSPLFVSQNNRIIVELRVGDEIRSEVKSVLSKMRDEFNLDLHLLSGDSIEIVTKVGAMLDIEKTKCIGETSPEFKVEYIEKLARQTPTAMVGDGINDAGALKAATVGIAVHGGAEAIVSVCSVCLTTSGITPLFELFSGARRTFKVVHRNLLFSGAYNLLGGIGAAVGLIGPLEAAILMPISSISVILFASLSKSY